MSAGRIEVSHLGIELDCGDAERLELAQRRLMDNALAQPRVPTHRDYMPRNLMPVEGGPAVLDFQDLVLGPVAPMSATAVQSSRIAASSVSIAVTRTVTRTLWGSGCTASPRRSSRCPSSWRRSPPATGPV